MEGDEAEFSVESALDSQVYLWSDKYRPRKPRYFNRVHTGFEWNKYNQTHYDMDNPPPKIVQGYKFNIFYPDLIDKSSTPQYFLVSTQKRFYRSRRVRIFILFGHNYSCFPFGNATRDEGRVTVLADFTSSLKTTTIHKNGRENSANIISFDNPVVELSKLVS